MCKEKKAKDPGSIAVVCKKFKEHAFKKQWCQCGHPGSSHLTPDSVATTKPGELVGELTPTSKTTETIVKSPPPSASSDSRLKVKRSSSSPALNNWVEQMKVQQQKKEEMVKKKKSVRWAEQEVAEILVYP
jgi:hypothetical protein